MQHHLCTFRPAHHSISGSRSNTQVRKRCREAVQLLQGGGTKAQRLRFESSDAFAAALPPLVNGSGSGDTHDNRRARHRSNPAVAVAGTGCNGDASPAEKAAAGLGMLESDRMTGSIGGSSFASPAAESAIEVAGSDVAGSDVAGSEVAGSEVAGSEVAAVMETEAGSEVKSTTGALAHRFILWM